MKKIILSIVIISSFVITSCSNKAQVNMANCKDHERNCPLSENCPEHPECEAHESCPKGQDCEKHPSCVAYDQSKK